MWVPLSRLLNVLTLGSGQHTFCARAARNSMIARGWRGFIWRGTERALDLLCWIIYREEHHCLSQYVKFYHVDDDDWSAT